MRQAQHHPVGDERLSGSTLRETRRVPVNVEATRKNHTTMRRFVFTLAALAMSVALALTGTAQTGASPVIVTRDNFVRAETDFHFAQMMRGDGSAGSCITRTWFRSIAKASSA